MVEFETIKSGMILLLSFQILYKIRYSALHDTILDEKN